jgi:nucleoside phosphorylase
METKNIYQKLHEAKLEIGKVAKNAKNPHFKNTYADLNALIEAVEPILLEKGLVLLQPIKEGRVFTIITSIEDSNSIESYIDLTPGLTAQALGSQITYFRRYTLSSLLSLQAVDDDGHTASQPQKQPTQPEAKPQKKECDDKTFEVVKKAILDGKKTIEQAKEVFIFTGTQNIELLNLKK